MPIDPPLIVLASQSPYRRALLARLVPEFRTVRPDVDESPRPGESPRSLATRLAELKARAGARAAPGALIIGSDQVAVVGTRELGKPGTPERAVEQLLACAGRSVEFLTAVCVLGPDPGDLLCHTDVTQVRFRSFDRSQAERYVQRDQPLDCAGSFKAESLGVVLMEAIESQDPTGLQGLPLIWLAQALQSRGIALL